jgi:hypothetical protein
MVEVVMEEVEELQYLQLLISHWMVKYPIIYKGININGYSESKSWTDWIGR